MSNILLGFTAYTLFGVYLALFTDDPHGFMAIILPNILLGIFLWVVSNIDGKFNTILRIHWVLMLILTLVVRVELFHYKDVEVATFYLYMLLLLILGGLFLCNDNILRVILTGLFLAELHTLLDLEFCDIYS